MSACVNRSEAPLVKGFGDFDLPEPAAVALPNGATLYLLDRGDIPVCRLTACWNAGRADAPSVPALVLAANTIRCGTASRTEEEIAETLEFNGAWLRCNADNHASFLTLHSLDKTFGKVLPVVADMLSDATYPARILDTQRAKTAAQLEIKNRRINVKAEHVYNSMAFGENAPLARHYTESDVMATDNDAVREAYAGLFRGNTPAFFLAGRISDTEARLAIELLGNIPYAPCPEAITRGIIPAPPHTSDCEKRSQVDGSMQTAIKIGIPTIGRDHPDFERLRMAVMLLGGYFGSRLMTNIREEKGYTYGISASLNGALEGAAVEIACQTDNRFADDVLRETDKEIRRLADEPVGQAELDAARNILVSAMAGVTDTPFSIADYLVSLHTLGLPASHFRRQLEAARAVTTADINRLAAEYLAGRPRLTALAGDFR
ncbi:MAG: insulinase family protein [Muribaculaceae bacterium]|nr:insulinase family protein [Muribaculaceae bacterium]